MKPGRQSLSISLTSRVSSQWNFSGIDRIHAECSATGALFRDNNEDIKLVDVQRLEGILKDAID